MKLTSMKLSESDLKRQQEKYSKPVAEGERFPYGLELHLDNDVVEKLDLGDELPEVGTTMTLMATVKVTSVSSRDEAGGGKRRSVSLQITAMGLESDAGSSNVKKAEKLYGG